VLNRRLFLAPNAIEPRSWNAASPVKMTSDSKVASPPGAGSIEPPSPPAPTVDVIVQLGAEVAALSTLAEPSTGLACPANRMLYTICCIVIPSPWWGSPGASP
jgi:hypothetical protein